MTVKRSDFLLEIGVEEMPARFMGPGLSELKSIAMTIFKEQRLSFESVETCGTPRRLTLFVKGLVEKQESLETEVKGPAAKVAFKDGVPTRAAEGFARSQGVSVAELIRKQVGHVEYLFAVRKEAGRLTRDVLPEIAPFFISGLHFPKPMRWGDLDIRFARPIRWILSIYGDDIVEFEYAGLKSGRVTYGHRFLSKEPLIVSNPEEYFKALSSNYVLVDPAERKRLIWQQVQDLAASIGGRVEENEGLLDEVNNLVEYPTALIGEFDRDFLRLPKEVLVTPMREHQRYFPVLGEEDSLLPIFIAVKNGDDAHLDTIRDGNEKVLRARLADADFFFQEDLKTPLAEKVSELKKIVYLEGLGTIYDKTMRLRELAGYLSEVTGASADEKEHVLRAAYLAKADQVTNIVYEFPELQGVMGREYAIRSEESEPVAVAIYEHYLPRFAGDRLPSTLAGKILSIADKVDNIVGCFSAGIQPSGSQDPYALRRQALGVSNIIIDGEIPVSLTEMIKKAYNGFSAYHHLKHDLTKVLEDVTEFFRQRLKGIFGDRGFSFDIIEAVLAPGYDDFNDTMLRGRALSQIRRDETFDGLLTSFVRANNLARNAPSGKVNPELLQDASEKALYDVLSQLQRNAGLFLQKQDYPALLGAIAKVHKPLEDFFNSVMVMADDEKIRVNRLTILANLAAVAKQVADLSKIVVDTK